MYIKTGQSSNNVNVLFTLVLDLQNQVRQEVKLKLKQNYVYFFAAEHANGRNLTK